MWETSIPTNVYKDMAETRKMKEGLRQLCRSYLDEGIYDHIIKDLLCSGECGGDIMFVIMTLSRGHENPKMVDERIDELRITLNT